jgi:hypothetical protein
MPDISNFKTELNEQKIETNIIEEIPKGIPETTGVKGNNVEEIRNNNSFYKDYKENKEPKREPVTSVKYSNY